MSLAIEQDTPPRTKGLVIHWAARYDLMAWLLTGGRERAFRERILRRARLTPGQAVLDIGCGTGTLAIAAARYVGPTGTVRGIDASPEMIARATHKARKAAAPIVFQLAAAEKLPFADGQFDIVLSTLMLHHLPRNTRLETIAEIRRVLKSGGRTLIVDFRRPQRKGLLSHFHRHGHIDFEALETVVKATGLVTVESGPIGMRDLHFVSAEAPQADGVTNR